MLKVRFTRKQAGVIYRAVKEGKIQMSKEDINSMYYWADRECYSDTADAYHLDELKLAIDLIFEGCYEGAQNRIDIFRVA